MRVYKRRTVELLRGSQQIAQDCLQTVGFKSRPSALVASRHWDFWARLVAPIRNQTFVERNVVKRLLVGPSTSRCRCEADLVACHDGELILTRSNLGGARFEIILRAG